MQIVAIAPASPALFGCDHPQQGGWTKLDFDLETLEATRFQHMSAWTPDALLTLPAFERPKLPTTLKLKCVTKAEQSRGS